MDLHWLTIAFSSKTKYVLSDLGLKQYVWIYYRAVTWKDEVAVQSAAPSEHVTRWTLRTIFLPLSCPFLHASTGMRTSHIISHKGVYKSILSLLILKLNVYRDIIYFKLGSVVNRRKPKTGFGNYQLRKIHSSHPILLFHVRFNNLFWNVTTQLLYIEKKSSNCF